MRSQVYLGDDRRLTLRRVILLYAADRGLLSGAGALGDAYAISAPASIAAATGESVIGAYEPVTMEFVQELARGLGVDLPREVLPANVLCRTQDVIVWWTPPGKEILFFSDSCPLADLSGESFPVPALVWRLELGDNRLYVRAFRGEDRPGTATTLYFAPFLNVYPQGLVCQGTMRRPKVSTLASLQEWQDGFFAAAGGQQFTPRATRHRKGLHGLWRTLRRRKVFPDRYLSDAEESLTAFVTGGAR